MTVAAWICLLFPLAGALAITLAGTRISRRVAGYVSTLTTFGAFAGAIVSFAAMWGRAKDHRTEVSTAWTWLQGGSYHSGLSILVDPLSVMMMLIVAGVGALIVAYSIGYMDGEDEERRFFAYMSLFVFSMLLLVEGGNLLLIAFSRLHGREDGQVFAISVMAVAASEVVVGLGMIVALGRRHVDLDVDKLRTLRG